MLVIVNPANGGRGVSTWVSDGKGVRKALPIDGHCPNSGGYSGGWVAIADLGN